MTKEGSKQENLIGRKKINHYTAKQCETVLARLMETKDESKYARHVSARLNQLSPVAI